MTGVELRGLDGANPLAFFAALGLLVVAERMGTPLRLRWTDTAISRPVIERAETVEHLAEMVDEDRQRWRDAAVFCFPVASPAADVKFTPADLRGFIRACDDADDGGRSLALCSAVVAEGVTDESGKAKPTDLHFTAGKQLFLVMARQLCAETTLQDVLEALEQWRYERELPSLRWDVADDRAFALSAVNPSGEKKRTVPGAEWLALQGITLIPAVKAGSRVIGPGLSGPWKQGGSYTWPLWGRPASPDAVRTMLRLAGAVELGSQWEMLASSLSVFRVMQSAIRRSEQGGYGSFGPAKVMWEPT